MPSRLNSDIIGTLTLIFVAPSLEVLKERLKKGVKIKSV